MEVLSSRSRRASAESVQLSNGLRNETHERLSAADKVSPSCFPGGRSTSAKPSRVRSHAGPAVRSISVASDGEVTVVETEPQGKIEPRRRLHEDAANVVGHLIFEAAAGLERGILIGPCALADQRGRTATARAVEAEADSVIHARSGLDAIKAGMAIGAEQVGVIELQIPAVFVGNIRRIAAFWADHALHDGFDKLSDKDRSAR